MTRILFTFLLAVFCTSLYSQDFHEKDKEGLRAILRQSSSVSGKSNLECLGLTAADTANWRVSEDWIAAIQNKLGLIYIDWEWTVDAPARLTRLEINSFTDEYQLSGIIGGSYFEELEVLNFPQSKFTALNILDNPKLNRLDCSGNGLTELDLTRNVNLLQLNCSDNQLAGLNLSANLDLGVLNCSNNLITELDLSKQKSLISLYCSGNKLNELSLSTNSDLASLDCSDNSISQLNLSKNNKIGFLSCSGNPLNSAIDLSQKERLLSFYSVGAQLSGLILPQSSDLSLLYLPDNQLTGDLDLSQHTKLNWLNVSNNQLTELKVASPLRTLYFNDNSLKFSAMQVGPVSDHEIAVYSPQKIIDAGEIHARETIDLNREYNIYGNTTTYNWYNEADQAITLPDQGEGRFEASLDFYGEVVTCKMTNLSFPDLTVNYQVKISDTITGIQKEVVRNEILIYPNPVSEVLYVETLNPVNGIELYNTTGQIVKRDSQETTRYEISVGELPPGVYVLRTTTASGKKITSKVQRK
ncbi:T9SS type A sorting domain-containing protein [Viscerimonas tarda]